MVCQPAVVADIGGTNARFALVDLTTLATSNLVVFPSQAHASLQSAAAAYLKALRVRPRLAAFAVAGPVLGDTVSVTNLGWVTSQGELRDAIGAEVLLVLNDFEALAHSLPLLREPDLFPIGGGSAEDRATKVVLGPGTGLGVAGLGRSKSGWVPIPGEGGHISFGARDPHEFELLERLRAGRVHFSAERVLSGPGLMALYATLAKLNGAGVAARHPREIVESSYSGADPIARQTVEQFIVWLGRFAGDVALLFGAKGGVYLGGGIAPKIISALQAGSFREAFEAKGRLSDYLARIPIQVILAGDAGLRGAAAALAAAMVEDVSHSDAGRDRSAR